MCIHRQTQQARGLEDRLPAFQTVSDKAELGGDFSTGELHPLPLKVAF